MLKLIGALLIFSACASVGISAATMYRIREEQLEAFRALIAHIGAQIGGFLAPLDRIYADFKNFRLEECGFLAVLRRSDALTALRECRDGLVLSELEINELEKFFGGLGRYDVKEEERHCAYFEKRIGEMCAAARTETASKSRLYRTFGILAGIMLAVILL